MDFISYMLTNMQYHGLFAYIMRSFLWWIVGILKDVCNEIEKLFNIIFKMISFFYSSQLLSYIQENFMPLIVVLLSVSFIMLGYNLITKSDESDRKGVVGAFSQNFLLFLIIMFFIPFVLTGNNPLSGDKFDITKTAVPYDVISKEPDAKDIEYDPDTYVPKIKDSAKKKYKKQSEQANGVLNILKNLALGTFAYDQDSEDSTAENVISKNVTDWLWVYNQIGSDGKYGGSSLTSNDAGDKIRAVSQKHYELDDITDINITSEIDPSSMDADSNGGTAFQEIEWDTVFPESSKIKNDLVLYESAPILTSEGNYDTAKTTMSLWRGNYDKNHTSAYYGYSSSSKPTFTDYIFGYTHQRQNLNNNEMSGILYLNNKSGTLFSIDFLSEFPYRYTVNWMPMLVELIAVILVFFALSFKTATLIWELAVNHILLYLFAAGDLTSGRKVREILKSIFSIIATIIFAYIDLQVFLISCDYLDSVANGGTLTNLQAALIKFFFAYACIDGPAILERIFGIDAGLRRPAAALLGALGTGMQLAKAGAKAVGKSAKGLGKGAVGIGGYMAGKNEAKRELARNEHGGLIGGTEKNKNDKQSKRDKPFEVPNDKAQNGDNDKPKSPEEHQKAYQDYFDKQKEGYMNNNGMSEKDASKIAKKDADEKFGNRNPAYHDAIKDQCQNDLGMSEEDANKVADYMTEAMHNPNFDPTMEEHSDICSTVGDHIDYDTATKSKEEGGLGLSPDKALDMMDNSADLGASYMTEQLDKKAAFNSFGSRAATAEARNARSEALGGSNISNDINRSSRAAHGAGVSSIFAPKIAKQMRSAREAGYNKVMYKNSDDYAQKRQSKGKSTKVPKRYSYDEELERLNQEDDES